jgi:hypothetical protein
MPLRAPNRPRKSATTSPSSTACGGTSGHSTGLGRATTWSSGTPRRVRYAPRRVSESTTSRCGRRRARTTPRAGRESPSNQSRNSEPCRCITTGTPRDRASSPSSPLRSTDVRCETCMCATAGRPTTSRRAAWAVPPTIVHSRVRTGPSRWVVTTSRSASAEACCSSTDWTLPMPPRASARGPTTSTAGRASMATGSGCSGRGTGCGGGGAWTSVTGGLLCVGRVIRPPHGPTTRSSRGVDHVTLVCGSRVAPVIGVPGSPGGCRRGPRDP